MRNTLRKFIKWVMREDGGIRELNAVAAHAADRVVTTGSIQFTINKAENGHVITFSRYRPNPHGPDWTNQLYVVPTGTDLFESLRVCAVTLELSK